MTSTHQSTPAELPLLDREAELSALRRAVADAADGTSRVVLVEGDPGAGKTRLVGRARALAAVAGMRVLSARGAVMEREHPYGIVRQLFEASLLGPARAGWLDEPVPARAAESVFRPETAVDPDAFATLGGLFWVTANAADDGPLALVIDDLHWADQSSVHFLQYLLRRIDDLPVLLVLGARPVRTASLLDLVAEPSILRLRPAPLAPPAVERLTSEILGATPSARFADACRRASGGNPLLLVELLRTLQAEGVAPGDEQAALVDDVGPSSLARVALVRLRRLGGDAVRVAQAIALLGSGASTSLVAALAEVDEREVAPAVTALVDAAVLEASVHLDFVHPVVRDAVYRELAPDERDRHHARAADLLRARAAEAHVIGAHLLLSAPRGERWAAEVLRAAAADAARRGAVDTAVTFGRRALEERPADADADALVRLALTEATYEPEVAIARVEEARRIADGAEQRAQIGELLTRMLVFGRPRDAVRAAAQARAELPPGRDDQAAGLLALERYAGRFAGVRALPLAAPSTTGVGGRMQLAVKAWDEALGGEDRAACVEQACDALLLDGPDSTSRVFGRNGLLTALIGTTVLLLADDDRGPDLWERWTSEAVRAGRRHAVVADDVWRAFLHRRRGHLADAEALLRAVVQGADGLEPPSPGALALLVQVLLERGELEEARAILGRLPASARPETEGELQCRVGALRLLLAEGRHQDAVDGVVAIRDQLETVRNPVWDPWRSVHAEALAGVGRTAEAIAAAEEELDLAQRWGTPAPVGRALAVLGTLEGRLDRLEEAVARTDGPWSRLEHANALLALGGALRRAKRPAEARTPLRDAHDLAVRCGATGLARAARDELAAAGGRPRATADSGPDALTPSERRIAELAGSGRRNQEIAQQLFLSPKTVETHLSSVYRKLGIRTRGELQAALGGP